MTNRTKGNEVKLENVEIGQEFKITSGFFSPGHDNPHTIWKMKSIGTQRNGIRKWSADSYLKVWNGQEWVKEMRADTLIFYDDQVWEIEVEVV